MKRRIAAQGALQASLLPYNEDVLLWLREQKAEGRTLVLATAADQALADRVAEYLGLFDGVIASDGNVNVKGRAKLERLRERFGADFDYAGDAKADLPIWAACQHAILVNPSRSTEAAARQSGRVERVFRGPGNRFRLILRELRVYQWIKNALIFVPLITSHQVGHLDLLWRALISFTAFSLCASAVYLINDVADLEADRRHSHKRFRPFASGDLSIAYAFVLTPVLVVAAFALAAILGRESLTVLAAYFVITLLYTFWLKRKLLVDVFILACLYTLRIIAGRAAYGVALSSWLLSFTMFLFVSLGFCKRASELYNLQQGGASETSRRGYRVTDLAQVNVFGVTTGSLASLVLILYMSSDNIRILYKQPNLLWLLFPMMLYWTSRIWMITSRGKMNEDPILFAVKDPVTRGLAVLVVLLMFLATRDWVRF